MQESEKLICEELSYEEFSLKYDDDEVTSHDDKVYFSNFNTFSKKVQETRLTEESETDKSNPTTAQTLEPTSSPACDQLRLEQNNPATDITNNPATDKTTSMSDDLKQKPKRKKKRYVQKADPKRKPIFIDPKIPTLLEPPTCLLCNKKFVFICKMAKTCD